MRFYLLCVFSALCMSICASAQTGLPPFGSLDRVDLEVRNNQNLNTVLTIPIASSIGRGFNLDFSIAYNSLNWAPGGGAWYPAYTSNPNALFGWQTAFNPTQTTFVTTNSQGTCGHTLGDTGATYITKQNQYKYVDAYGTAHPFTVWWQDTYSECTGSDTYIGTFSGYAADGSGYYLAINGTTGAMQTLLGANGYNLAQNGKIIDPNGNYISASSQSGETDWTDSVGRVALKIITGASAIQYKFLDPTGAYQTTTLNLQTLNVKTNFGCSGITEYNGTASLPSTLVLPNGQTYTFTYEPTPGNSGYYTGRLQRMAFPTGGYHEFDYPGANDGINCSDGTVLSMNRVVSDGTSTATWNYVRNTSSRTTTITTPKLVDTPNANDLVVTFNSSGQEVSRQIYSNSPGSGGPIRTINTTWASNGTPATRVTILEDGSTQSKIATTYDSNGLLDSMTEYDWGSGAPGGAFRTTTYTYQTSTNYTSRNLIGLVTSKQISSGTVLWRQDTTYDGTALTNCPTGALQHDDTDYPCTMNYRGNPTAVTTYLSPSVPSGGITKNVTYDLFGNVLTAQVNCCTLKAWTYSSSSQYSQPDSMTSGTSPTQLMTSYAYNSSTGLLASTTDPNGLVTNYSYDVLRRPTQMSQANGSVAGGTINYSHDDVHFTTTVKTAIDATKDLQQVSALDGLGLITKTTTEDVNGSIISMVNTNSDLAGRAYQTSNPYSSGNPSYWTITQLDVLGRPVSATLPDNSATIYAYTNQYTTVTDPAGIQRKSQADAAGRTVSVWEPDPTNGNSLTLQTTSAYSVLDELTAVTQGSQARTYTYDSLGRMLSATTPEAGRICFGSVSGSNCNADGYDNWDNLVKRTDARGVLTSYGFDGLNRLISIIYTTAGTTAQATPSVSLTYGTNTSQFNNGLLTTMTDGVGSESYSYNSLEQNTQLNKVISSTTYSVSYSYNLAGQLTKITYPSNRIVQQSVDAVGRVCEIAPSTTGCGTASSPYATGLGYNAASQLIGFKYGNGIYASFGFSADLALLTCLDYSTTNRSGICLHDSTTKFGLSYSYPAAPSNNGQIKSIADSVDSGRNVAYTYDALYRLSTAVSTGSANYPAWGLSEAYDRYANRSAQSIYSGCVHQTCPTNSVVPNATTNHFGSPYIYDAVGNMTNDGLNSLVYDAENHAVGSGSGTYIYDGNGRRVKKVSGATTTVYVFVGNKVIAEYENGASPSAPTREYVYGGTTLLAKIDSTGTKYYHPDHLSNRLVTDSGGNTYAQLGHFPFGESWYNSTSDKLAFTTYERDAESGNDYAMARTYVSRLGRMSSPDPIAGNIANPQSLNRYAYVENSPTNAMDSSGLCTIFIGGVRDNADNSNFNKAANAVGGIYVAAYDGQSTVGAIINIAAQSLVGPNGSSQAVADATKQIADDPNGIQIVAFSGGAQAFSSAAQSGGQMDPQEGGSWSSVPPLISQTALDNITQITYLSPGIGPFGGLYKGPDTTIFHGHGGKDLAATLFAKMSGDGGTALPCKHDFSCEFGALDESITSNLTPCPGRKPTNSNGGGGGNGGADGGGQGGGPPTCSIVYVWECYPGQDGGQECTQVPILSCGSGGGGGGRHPIPIF